MKVTLEGLLVGMLIGGCVVAIAMLVWERYRNALYGYGFGERTYVVYRDGEGKIEKIVEMAGG